MGEAIPITAAIKKSQSTKNKSCALNCPIIKDKLSEDVENIAEVGINVNINEQTINYFGFVTAVVLGDIIDRWNSLVRLGMIDDEDEGNCVMLIKIVPIEQYKFRNTKGAFPFQAIKKLAKEKIVLIKRKFQKEQSSYLEIYFDEIELFCKVLNPVPED
jgi:hypothetical protein